MTLESQLGIKSNGFPGPDKLGWELKGHTVTRWEKMPSKPISLITTEPDGGIYVDNGLSSFIDQFGHTDSMTTKIRGEFIELANWGDRNLIVRTLPSN